MKNRLKSALLGNVMIAALVVSLAAPANAQVAPVPPKPGAATETFDYYAIDNLQRTSQNTFISNVHGFKYLGNLDAIAIGPMTRLPTNVMSILTANLATTVPKMNNMDANVKSILDLLTAELTTTPAPLGGGTVPTLYNTPTDQAERVTVPDFGNMTEVLRTTGAVAAPALVPVMSAAITRYSLENTIKVIKTGPASLYVTSDARSHLASSSVTASAVAEAAFKSASASTGRLNTYISAIETSPDIKTSFDLRTRVMLELLQQNNELLRTKAAKTAVMTNHMMLNLRSD